MRLNFYFTNFSLQTNFFGLGMVFSNRNSIYKTMEKKTTKAQASKEMRDPKASKEEKSQAAKTLSSASKKATKK